MAMSAAEASERAGSGRSVIGWKVDREQRKELLLQFPPKFPDVVADHVTLKAKASPKAALPPEAHCEIVGRIDDGDGVEALVVRMDGSTDRPDGSTYHITWSLDKSKGRTAKESNDVIAKLGWRQIELPVPVQTIPARWP